MVTQIDMTWIEMKRSWIKPFMMQSRQFQEGSAMMIWSRQNMCEETVHLIATSLIWAIQCHSLEEKDSFDMFYKLAASNLSLAG